MKKTFTAILFTFAALFMTTSCSSGTIDEQLAECVEQVANEVDPTTAESSDKYVALLEEFIEDHSEEFGELQTQIANGTCHTESLTAYTQAVEKANHQWKSKYGVTFGTPQQFLQGIMAVAAVKEFTNSLNSISDDIQAGDNSLTTTSDED